MGSWFGDIFGRLAGRRTQAAPGRPGPAVDYKGYTIRAAARRQGAQWLTAGVIAKPVGDEVKEHHFIRAETHGSREAADGFAVVKAKQIIDELGDRLFRDG